MYVGNSRVEFVDEQDRAAIAGISALVLGDPGHCEKKLCAFRESL
jgi:hypothetical protein